MTVSPAGNFGAQYLPIFDTRDRVNVVPCGHGESTFTFLNRVAGEYWDQVRDLIQRWANRIDDPAEYNEIRSRFLTPDDYAFRSTFLELYLHEALIRAGFVVKIHPDIPGTTRHPDFHAERDGEGFYLEAISPAASDEVRGKAARTAQVYDAVNGIKNDDFLIYVTELHTGSGPVKVSRLRSDLEAWLNSFDVDDYQPGVPWPEKDWQVHDWSASFKAIPKPAHRRGEHEQAIGIYPAAVERIDEAPVILSALLKKHKRYGTLSSPYVVAIGMYMSDTDRWHTSNALYGTLEYPLILKEGAGVVEGEPFRGPDGYFGVPDTWKNEHTSAVLLVNQLMPYYFHKPSVTDIDLWRHPAARYPLAENLGMPWSEVTFDAGLRVTPESIDRLEFFGLGGEWPSGEPWPR
ncbi:hypothetical protein AB0H76_26270 [Nocardia sp. NPDC050712]|uniref:hypothetical protein n=1 Tax=Nocardia sp. NPDC050712 TaxID=3155518 RepID=UPI0033C8650C